MKLTIIAIILTICIAYVACAMTTETPKVTTVKGKSQTVITMPTNTKSSNNSGRPSISSKVTSNNPNKPSTKTTSKSGSVTTITTPKGGSSSVAPSMWMITLISAVVYQYLKH